MSTKSQPSYNKLYNIYNNLLELSKKSKITLDNGKHNALDETNFNSLIKNNEFIFITGEKTYTYGKIKLNQPIKQYIILVAEKSEYGKKFPKIKELLKKTVGTSEVGEGNLSSTSEILIVVEDKPSASIERKILEMKNDNNGPYIHIHSYDIFKINIFNHSYVPEQEIIDEAAIKLLSDETFTNKNTHARIRSYDPAVVWLGAKPGHVIKIKRISESVGHSDYYRIVI